MSSLFKNLRVHQVFGANTDVGKTILTTALVRASASAGPVFYLKPVSTGPPSEADDLHVTRYSGTKKANLKTECLFRYKDPVSPHLAAQLAIQRSETREVPSDRTVVDAIANNIAQCAVQSTNYSRMFVETAGGVHSPTLSGTTQVDAYRPLFLPTVLVGDPKLGGISSTISAYESLLLRGYIVDAIILFRDEYYRNWEYLRPYFAERGVHVTAVRAPPPRLSHEKVNFLNTERYYDDLVTGETEISSVQQQLDSCHTNRINDLKSMPRRTLDSIWWPFVQHGLVTEEKDVTVIDSAQSDHFSVFRDQPSSFESLVHRQFDGSASWWTQTLGHAHPSLTLAAAQASGRYGHVMFPKATHLPALQLAERLLEKGPGKGWATRVFFSDDGSTGMEIALKMALRTFCQREGKEFGSEERKSLGILGLKGSYHGDTIGAMDACEEGVYTCEWHNAKGFWIDPPTVAIKQGRVSISVSSTMSPERDVDFGDFRTSLAQVYDVSARLDTPLASVYRAYIERTLQMLKTNGSPKLAALVLEPLVMGAGGMLFVDPLFQRLLVDTVRASEALPVIFDEVFVGLYRIGMQSTGPILGVNPDISVHAKILTGGLVPMAVTLASEPIFSSFWSEKKTDALLHGHSYTAHPIGCAVANETLRLAEKLTSSEEWTEAKSRWQEPHSVWSFWDPEFVEMLSNHSLVSEVMTLGTVLAFKFDDKHAGYSSQSAETVLQPLSAVDELGESVHFRTLGNVAYFITSLNTPADRIRRLEQQILNTVRKHVM